jgi:hypothetical protein
MHTPIFNNINFIGLLNALMIKVNKNKQRNNDNFFDQLAMCQEGT